MILPTGDIKLVIQYSLWKRYVTKEGDKMNLGQTIDVMQCERFYGRRPGMIKSNNPKQLLAKARELWSEDGSFAIYLQREMDDEVPNMKGATMWNNLTATQQKYVARRVHLKASQRMRARRAAVKAAQVKATEK